MIAQTKSSASHSKKDKQKGRKKVSFDSEDANDKTGENSLKKNEILDNFELNNLEYDEACEFDKRGFCKTYWSVLLREHVMLFTFFTCYDYN